MSPYVYFFWLVPVVLAVILYKMILRLVFGMVIVPENRIGLVIKKFVVVGAGRSLPDGRIIATHGEAGFQASTLAPGLYWRIWPWQYSIDMIPFTVIPEGKIGLVLARDGAEIPTGRILARKVPCDNFQDARLFLDNGGQRGRQTGFITAGSYRINTFLFDITIADQLVIHENRVGVITTLDGAPIERGQIAGRYVDGHNNFQDVDSFLNNGGNRGLQPQVVLAGSYYINPWAVQVEEWPMTDVPIGHVGVVISYIGEDGTDVTGENFRHGNIVAKGFRGVWMEPLGRGNIPSTSILRK